MFFCAAMVSRIKLISMAIAWSLLFMTVVQAKMTGSQSITPHDYQSLGQALALSAPSCGFPYVSLDISRITAVQKMNVASECGTCLRVETPLENYIEDGLTVGIPGVAMATHFEATTTKFEQLPTTSISLEKRGVGRSGSVSDQVRYIYVLAVDTGGMGLDMAQVSFTALFGQSLSPSGATWFPVDSEYCQDIWRNTTKKQLKSPTSMRSIPIYTGKSIAPAGLTQVKYKGGTDSDETSNASFLYFSKVSSLILMFIFLYLL